MITHIDEISVQEFNARLFDKQYFIPGKPLIVRNFFIEEDKYARWTPEFLMNAVKGDDRPVGMSVYTMSEDKHEQFFRSGVREDHGLQEAMALAVADPEGGKYYNLLESSIPALVEKVEIPAFLTDKTNSSEGYLWIGNGNITPLHFDAPNNFYFQIKGSKIFHIFEPSHYFYLYPSGSNASAISDVETIDQQKYPLAKHVKPVVVRLEPGDFLYLPPFWWHQVESAGAYISLNYWGYPRVEQCLCYPGFYELLRHFELGILIRMYERTNKHGAEDFTIREVVQMLLARGYNWAAYIFGMALFQDRLYEILEDAGISPSADIISRTEEFFARMDRQEMNLDNIRYETLGEDRFYDASRLLHTHEVVSRETADRLYRFASFLKQAKSLDNVTVSPQLVNDMMDFHEELATFDVRAVQA
ncbi:cupin-like domain-containing protein [Chitinophaga sp. Mgbs1]|uniref:Cupin-like domain-containing protein n=1 Tax=Chitinophaga solisilvae TaxID=1233460 RepID=A0A3S1B0W6_9BACT|nr:cupin-like domain-containing protein [Chitinophaga solisilvae]